MQVLLSIKPEHVANILNGTKTFEFRRKIFARRDVRSVLIYSTRPVGLLVAEFTIAGLIEDQPEALWDRTHHGSGISKAFYDSYFAGRERAFAIEIGDLTVFDEPLEPSSVIEDFTPPQSYRYVSHPRAATQPVLI
jgi:predicted transcriptional regulator